MKKSDKIAGMVRGMGIAGSGMDARYAGYFVCFNEGRYYEAHDVLEDLWLGTEGGNHAFYKGLIQLAGAFVHLKKQYERPGHPKDGVRARPAARLFLLAAGNLEAYRPRHEGLDVEGVWRMSVGMAERIEGMGWGNPWTPEGAPKLTLEAGGGTG
jgi:hypothetical protein